MSLQQEEVEGLEQVEPLDQVKAPDEIKIPQYKRQIYTTNYPISETESHFIVGHHSPNLLVQNILSHNQTAGFTGVLLVGQSGTGKTTLTKMMVHKLHTNGLYNYSPKWFFRNDIRNLAKIIKGLVKGINYILIFDDASFALDTLKKEELVELAQTLTYVRHIVKANVITIMNVHYGPAIKKFFRDVPFRLLTSISNEELAQYEDLFGSYAKWKLRDFTRHFQNMMIHGGWHFDLSEWTRKQMRFVTHKPFRLGLASELNDLHYFVYHKISCNVCDPDFQEKSFVSHEQLIKDLYNSYGEKDTNSVLKLYAYTNKGIKTFTSRKQSLWNKISELDKINNIKWKDAVDFLDAHSIHRRKRAYIRKQPLVQDANIGELVNPDFRL